MFSQNDQVLPGEMGQMAAAPRKMAADARGPARQPRVRGRDGRPRPRKIWMDGDAPRGDFLEEQRRPAAGKPGRIQPASACLHSLAPRQARAARIAAKQASLGSPSAFSLAGKQASSQFDPSKVFKWVEWVRSLQYIFFLTSSCQPA